MLYGKVHEHLPLKLKQCFNTVWVQGVAMSDYESWTKSRMRLTTDKEIVEEWYGRVGRMNQYELSLYNVLLPFFFMNQAQEQDTRLAMKIYSYLLIFLMWESTTTQLCKLLLSSKMLLLWVTPKCSCSSSAISVHSHVTAGAPSIRHVKVVVSPAPVPCHSTLTEFSPTVIPSFIKCNQQSLIVSEK